MPRARRVRDDDTFDPIAEELAALGDLLDRTRLAQPGMTPEKLAAEKAKATAKFDRRMAKTRAKWDRMTVFERDAWAKEYLRDRRKRYDSNATMPKAADLPLFFGIVTIAERDAAKEAKRPVVDYYDPHRPATRDANPATPRATLPSPAPEEPAADAEPSKPERPRKRRRGPAFGPVGQQIDGVFYPYITDGDDE